MKNVSFQSYPDVCCHYSWWILDLKSSMVLRENQVKAIMYLQQDIDSIRFCLVHSSPLLLWSWDKWIEKRELNKVFQSDLQAPGVFCCFKLRTEVRTVCNLWCLACLKTCVCVQKGYGSGCEQSPTISSFGRAYWKGTLVWGYYGFGPWRALSFLHFLCDW